MFLQEFHFVAHRPKNSPCETYGPVTWMFSPCLDMNVTKSEVNARLILWVHCGYASELIEDLRTCLKQELLDSLVQSEIGTLGRIELRGPKSTSVISKVFKSESGSETLSLELLNKACVHYQSGKTVYGAVLILSQKDKFVPSSLQIKFLSQYTKLIQMILRKILENLVNENNFGKPSSSSHALEIVVYLIVHSNGTMR